MAAEQLEMAIIGGGIAGISCAIYARRAGIKPVIFEHSAIGGQLLWVNRVDNYPGLSVHTAGSEIIERLNAAVQDLKLDVREEKIVAATREANQVIISSDRASYNPQSLVIATGAVFKTLDVPGESEFRGRGVSWCAVCDGYFFKDKRVAVIGGGNTAVEEAIYLSALCKKVYVVHRRGELRALDYLQKELSAQANIEVLWNSHIKEIRGGDFVENAVIVDTARGKETVVPLEGIFIAVGVKPSTTSMKDLIKTDDNGFIITDEAMLTSRPGVYACGDCRKRPIRQLITAAAEGAIAAISAYKFLKGSYISY